MKLLKSIRSWWRGFFRKRRFNMLNATDNSEEWHIHLSPASIFAGFVAFILLMFILILSLVAYTPALEFLPGYRTEADRSRESLVQNIIRLDSMERMMNDMMTYNENIALILEGQTPVARTLPASDSTRISKVLVMPSHEDSLLRAEMEGDGPYSLTGDNAASRRLVREAIQLTAPVDGIITDRFDIAAGQLGVKIAATAGDRITAIDKGTVVMSLWSPETGYVVCIQHAGNLISVYRQLSQSLVTPGQAIRPGEQIGYNAEAVNGEVPRFEFELWSNGKPVDPEGYIVF
ncbi:M23 family metallopeptidase [uncultured Alistipes sp.]|uniref:murein hydrolase activator EnvC family protein n=1 Tax=uncultured Alistipes sp. TaxID=538949 RepID=UPI00261C1C93|nr:M23 family metallopeptidase [uncultured Alistipes sp.]